VCRVSPLTKHCSYRIRIDATPGTQHVFNTLRIQHRHVVPPGRAARSIGHFCLNAVNTRSKASRLFERCDEKRSQASSSAGDATTNATPDSALRRRFGTFHLSPPFAIGYLLFAIRHELKASSRALLLAVDGVVEDSQVFLNNVRR
jgi:hypothetical protein